MSVLSNPNRCRLYEVVEIITRTTVQHDDRLAFPKRSDIQIRLLIRKRIISLSSMTNGAACFHPPPIRGRWPWRQWSNTSTATCS